MRNIKLVVDYEGTAYHGWQIQDNAETIEAKLNQAIEGLFGHAHKISASGRTDAGVHARGQVVNFKTDSQLPPFNILNGLNFYLPDDIAIRDVCDVDDDFNARFSARKRVYQYFISTEPSAIRRNFCWFVFSEFNSDILSRISEKIIGTHDFGAFCRVDTQTQHKRCSVVESNWRYENRFWIYKVAANRFLHGMVRTLVGTMIDTARGRFSEQRFLDIFRSGDRTQAGAAAPAKGLFLEEVVY